MEVKEPSAKYLARPRSKQTEVGVIPEDWEVMSLGSVCQIFGRIGFRGYTVNDIVTEGNGAIAINPSNIQGGRTDFSKCTYVSWPKYEESPEIKINDGDVLLVKTGSTFGKTAIVQRLPEKATLNPQVVVLKRIRLNSRFLGYAMGFSVIQNQISAAVVGGALPTLSQNLVARFKVAVPPTKGEQEAIAEALSDADALIESLEQLLAKKRQIKQGAMQELLTSRKRLPRFSDEWEVRRLDEIADIRSGGTPSTTQPQFWDGDVLWCTPTDITALNGYKYLNTTSRTISQAGLKSSAAELIPANSITMTSRATIGECAINKVPVTTNQGFKNFVPHEATDVEFLYYLLLTQKQRFISLCGGSTFLEIGKGQLAAYEVRVPATNVEQQAIATILSDMDAEIALMEEKLLKARRIKQGMMHELLTGKIRLLARTGTDSASC